MAPSKDIDMKNEMEKANRDFSGLVPSKKLALVFGGTFVGVGGMFEYGRAWLDQLRGTGWNVSVIASLQVLAALGESQELAIDSSEETTLNYRQIALASVLGVGAAKRLLGAVVKSIDLSGVDAIHIVDRALFSAFLAKGVRKRFPKVVTIVTIHDPTWHEERIACSAKILKARDDRMLSKMAEKNEIWIHVHAKQLTLGSVFQGVRNLIAVDHPAPLARVVRVRREIQRSLVSSGAVFPIRMGFVGRIEPYKGLDVFLEGLISLIEKQPEVAGKIEVLIAGRGNIDQGLVARVVCPLIIRNEFIEDLEFHQLVADLDLLVLPYKSATQSGVAMLGLTYRIPLIVTNVGGLPLLVLDGVTGYVMKHQGGQVLELLLARLMKNPELLGEMRGNMGSAN